MARNQPVVTPSGCITDVDGIEAGHLTHTERPTGCTVVLVRKGAVAGVDIRGGAPGTRETDLLRPECTVQQVHAVVLSGGSAYGLDTAGGVMRYLEEQRIGFPVGPHVVPIVPAAILFDLGLGDGKVRPTAESGYRAAKAAGANPLSQGNYGAGAGATVGKYLGGGRRMKGGLGCTSLRTADGLVVGAVVAVNAVGDVIDPHDGRVLAGAYGEDGSFSGYLSYALKAKTKPAKPGENTTIGVVAANVSWTQAQATKVAQVAQDGLARAIYPAHTPMDGDTMFALGTGGAQASAMGLERIGALAAEAVARAIVSAILHAESLPNIPAWRDLP